MRPGQSGLCGWIANLDENPISNKRKCINVNLSVSSNEIEPETFGSMGRWGGEGVRMIYMILRIGLMMHKFSTRF